MTCDDQPEDGFTLLELLVVLAIIASAIGLIASTVRLRNGDPSLAQSSQTLAAHLRRARVDAIAKREPRVLTIDVKGRRFWHHATPKKIYRLSPHAHVVATTARSTNSAGMASIGFFADGTSTGGDIVLRQDNQVAHIAIDWMTGAAHVSRGE